ncbi:hypothetical protein A4E84_24460 [Streptomyces qaidamensis]|uniref:Uncharacterized protein n=1 Tax=Streptomyces qaidamensis TaxID=1783515 RepID=A0A143C5W7_9ACTN|nr:hypothetical protein A4E84_24460 [Streptomyces qaidamensis]
MELVLGRLRRLTVSLGFTLVSALLQSGFVAAAAVPAVATVPVRAEAERAIAAAAVPSDLYFMVSCRLRAMPFAHRGRRELCSGQVKLRIMGCPGRRIGRRSRRIPPVTVGCCP